MSPEKTSGYRNTEFLRLDAARYAVEKTSRKVVLSGRFFAAGRGLGMRVATREAARGRGRSEEIAGRERGWIILMIDLFYYFRMLKLKRPGCPGLLYRVFVRLYFPLLSLYQSLESSMRRFRRWTILCGSAR